MRERGVSDEESVINFTCVGLSERGYFQVYYDYKSLSVLLVGCQKLLKLFTHIKCHERILIHHLFLLVL